MSEETEFAILYDEENLYIGVWCWDSEPDKIIQQLSPRGTSAPDHLMLFIDSFHDHRTGYKFAVSPTGVQVDELRYDDIKRDDNWNGIWYSEGTVDENGWYAEVKIPFFNFRYPRDSSQTWGFNIMRNISKNASRGQWKPHLPEWDNTTRMSQMGNIENIRNIRSGRTFEIRPYGVASLSESMGHDPLKTFSFGGDIRYSPGPNLTADFTFNPDFAQVDADIFEINLTRFPTRFKELRPFFTERINIFNTPLELFYSRRIGAKGDILGGIKMTGKLQHGIEFGVLGNLTGESFFSSSNQNVENALFGVMRVKKDILGSSSLGILAATKENAENYNRIVGFDGSFMLKYFSDTELTGSYSGNFIKMSYSTRPLSLGSQFAGKLSASGGTLYNFDQKYVGSQKSLSSEGEGRFIHNIITKLQGDFTKTYNPQKENDGRYFKLSSNTTWMFTKNFFIRVHAQGIFGTTYYEQRQFYNDYLLSGLLSWEYRPGSFLYLAYNEARFDNSDSDTNKYMEFKNRTLILKISYFFSI